MKKNAILIAGILAVTGAARAQQESSDRPREASPSATSTETVQRDSASSVLPPVYSDPSTAVQHDPAAAAYSGQISGTVTGENYEADAEEEFRINYSERDTDKEAEYSTHSDSQIKADSSIRGGSIYARDHDESNRSEPYSETVETKKSMKADSSIRGGSLEARGAREQRWNQASDHDDFGQGSSATWESDKAQGSVRGSANWNPSDDLMQDDMGYESELTREYEFNNDASLGGVVSPDTSDGSETLDDAELDYEASGAPAETQSESESSSNIESDLNSSEQLEENISGEYDIETQTDSDFESSNFKIGTSDPNALDTSDSSVDSRRSTDLIHNESQFTIPGEPELSFEGEDEMEAAGAAATSESGVSSSSDVDNESSIESDSSSEFENDSSLESNDPALQSGDTPLTDNDLDFLYRDNRAHGVGSLATGEFGAAAQGQYGAGAMSDDELARQVKARLTRESTGTHGLMRHEVARSVQVSAENGEITLSGTVPSEGDKELLEIRAAEMAGVKRVHNNITVMPGADSAGRDLSRGHDLEDTISDLQD